MSKKTMIKTVKRVKRVKSLAKVSSKVQSEGKAEGRAKSVNNKNSKDSATKGREFYSKSRDAELRDLSTMCVRGTDVTIGISPQLCQEHGLVLPVSIDGAFSTIESCYQAMKYAFAVDKTLRPGPKNAALIRSFTIGQANSDPFTAKSAGSKAGFKRNRMILDIGSWNAVESKAMLVAIHARALADSWYAAKLEEARSTGLPWLHIETRKSPEKCKWGGNSSKNGTYSGQNLLGQLMMQVARERFTPTHAAAPHAAAAAIAANKPH